MATAGTEKTRSHAEGGSLENEPMEAEPKFDLIESNKVEWVESYGPGGYHPISLGDFLGERYETFAKLGYGSYSTVWLCWDRQDETWRAVKVLSANVSTEKLPELTLIGRLGRKDLDSNHITLPLDSFWIDGPNGRHVCIVLPLLGPTIENAYQKDAGVHKHILFQVAQGLNYLHQNGVCHGDLRSENVLFKMPDLRHINKIEMRNLLGEPKLYEVYATDEKYRHMAPKYLVGSQSIKIEPTDNVTITDFGVAFEASDPPETAKIPMLYRPPEALLGMEVSFGLDLWAFACMILEVRHRQDVFTGSQLDEVIHGLEVVLGPLPDPYRSSYRKLRKEDASDDGEDRNEDGEAEDNPLETITEPGLIWQERDLLAQESGYLDPLEGKVAMERRQGKWEKTADGKRKMGVAVYKIPKNEVPLLLDLLRGCFKYNQSQRLSLEDMMNHAWFEEPRLIALNQSLEFSRLLPKSWRNYSSFYWPHLGKLALGCLLLTGGFLLGRTSLTAWGLGDCPDDGYLPRMSQQDSSFCISGASNAIGRMFFPNTGQTLVCAVMMN